MQLPTVLSLALTMVSLGAFVQGRPLPCPDEKRDDILNGKASPEICCSYGICKGDVVVTSG
ncbi:hypothetical protein CH063_15768 [Colletotrichum higginsianum]|uniref:Uncharacterized protein n=4 Tax=Colletotrichum destructivum species complex TaxID=2707350 RepID=H1W4D3_COLHI|nr:hypothetical protein CH63R_05704 [Colletotrichum higginsianum IMI 349063]TID06207.1 hypothetical protein CH35J_001414 [Colletotrichum higginsianum]TQN68140.1 hypothetical protein CSHISOI_07350 [Colletotrichum shisoi]OBR10012.1 hypothetical protein CH63R_05704 [Colletotrichum higginsianum IMI 349063]CCF47346.1 hypothetical protein CH063_15768 [Colletotrichum higginsianum]GJD02960.1 hypothetical protein ColKHC_11785 [Colletotrichum higginsianum]